MSVETATTAAEYLIGYVDDPARGFDSYEREQIPVLCADITAWPPPARERGVDKLRDLYETSLDAALDSALALVDPPFQGAEALMRDILSVQVDVLVRLRIALSWTDNMTAVADHKPINRDSPSPYHRPAATRAAAEQGSPEVPR